MGNIEDWPVKETAKILNVPQPPDNSGRCSELAVLIRVNDKEKLKAKIEGKLRKKPKQPVRKLLSFSLASCIFRLRKFSDAPVLKYVWAIH